MADIAVELASLLAQHELRNALVALERGGYVDRLEELEFVA